jgi:hypothetical protein
MATGSGVRCGSVKNSRVGKTPRAVFEAAHRR